VFSQTRKGSKMQWILLAIGLVVLGTIFGIIISAWSSCVVAAKADDQIERARRAIEADRKLPRRKQ